MKHENEEKRPQTTEEKLAAARARKAEREAKLDQADVERELLSLELEERFEKELGGACGEKFVVVQAGHRGPVVLKLGISVQHKAFNATVDENQKRGIGGKTGLTEECCTKFVKPSVVYPEIGEWQSIVEELPGVLYRCTAALASLFDGDRDRTRGKS